MIPVLEEMCVFYLCMSFLPTFKIYVKKNCFALYMYMYTYMYMYLFVSAISSTKKVLIYCNLYVNDYGSVCLKDSREGLVNAFLLSRLSS